MTRTQTNKPEVADYQRSAVGSIKATECDLTDHSSPSEIDRCIEYTRREMHDTLQVLEQRLTRQKLFDDAKTYMRQNYRRPMQWFSDLPRRVNTNPTPFAIIGAGMLIGGAGIAGYALSKQRRNAGKPSTFKSLAEKGRKTLRRRSESKQIPQTLYSSETTAQLSSTDPETFKGSQEYQASTEEILRDQVAQKEHDERGMHRPRR